LPAAPTLWDCADPEGVHWTGKLLDLTSGHNIAILSLCCLPLTAEGFVFRRVVAALKLAGTVLELDERLTQLEGNFDILSRAVKREQARKRAQVSRDVAAVDQEPAPDPEKVPAEGGLLKPRSPGEGGLLRRVASS
jgi:hypothetical protein